MANGGVDGRLTIFGTGPVSGFTVEVYRAGINRETKLGEAPRDGAGNYSVRYSANSASF